MTKKLSRITLYSVLRPAGSFFIRSNTAASVVPGWAMRKLSTEYSPRDEAQRVPPAIALCCGTSFIGRPTRAPLAGSSTMRQPTDSCFGFAAALSAARSGWLSTPVSLPPLRFWNALTAAIARSLNSPLTRPL
jgi:hypothetical protein